MLRATVHLQSASTRMLHARSERPCICVHTCVLRAAVYSHFPLSLLAVHWQEADLGSTDLTLDGVPAHFGEVHLRLEAAESAPAATEARAVLTEGRAIELRAALDDERGGRAETAAPAAAASGPTTPLRITLATPPPATNLPTAAAPAASTSALDLDAVVAEASHRLFQLATRAMSTFVTGASMEEEAPAPSPARTAEQASYEQEQSAEGDAPRLPEETRTLLSELDDRLVEVLQGGDIALLRTAWLLALPEGKHLVRRQELEVIEGITPLLTPQEAVGAIRAGNRSVGALSHGWMSPVGSHAPSPTIALRDFSEH